MGKAFDLTGQTFERLRVVERYGTDKYHSATWLCECECGNIVIKNTSALRAGYAKSCGCLHKESSSARMTKQNTTHGLSNTRLYHIWTDIKKRCCNPKHWAYSRYGGRGIKLCSEWQGFEPFYEWATANGYRANLTIDRIDNDGNYEPTNCRWCTRKEQANNKSNTVRYELKGKFYTLSELSDIYGISYNTLHARIHEYGWSLEKSVTKPIKGGGERYGVERLSN